MVFNQTEKQERSYLQQIINRLKQIISHTDVSVKDHVDTLACCKTFSIFFLFENVQLTRNCFFNR